MRGDPKDKQAAKVEREMRRQLRRDERRVHVAQLQLDNRPVPPHGAVVVKAYKTPKDMERDAAAMVQAGYMPQGMAGGNSHFAPVQGIVKGAGTGLVVSMLGLPAVLGFLGSKKWRKSDPLTVTWVRAPRG